MAANESVSLTTRDECPLPVVSSTSNTPPAGKRRDWPSLAVTSHSPDKTRKIFRADVGCQSLDQPAGAFMKPNCVAGVNEDRLNGGAEGTYLDSVRSISMSSKCDSPCSSL